MKKRRRKNETELIVSGLAEDQNKQKIEYNVFYSDNTRQNAFVL